MMSSLFSLGKSIAKCVAFEPILCNTSLRVTDDDATSKHPKSKTVGIAMTRVADNVLYDLM